MCIVKSPLIFLSLAFILCPLRLLGQFEDIPAEIRQAWLSAYLLIEKADQQSSAGDILGALDLLRQSWDTLARLQKEHPRWNPSMLAFRMENCRQKILALEGREQGAIAAMSREELEKFLRAARERLRLAHALSQQPPDASASDSPLPMPAQMAFLTRLNAEKQQYQAENSDLKTSLQELKTKLEQAELQAQAWRRTAAGTDKLQQELTALKAQNQELDSFRQKAVLELHEQNSKVHALTQELSGAKAALTELRRTPQADLAEDKIAAAQQAAAQQVAAAQQAAAAQIAAAKAESSRLVQEQWSAAQQQLKDLQEQLSGLKKELEQAKAAELRREKENQALADFIQKAIALEQSGEWGEAAKLWQRIASARPGHVQTLARIPVLLQQAGEQDQAGLALNNYLNQAAGDFNTLLSLGESCLQANQPAYAVTFLSWCTLLQPDNVQAKAALGMAYAAAEMPQAAENYLRQALATDADYQPALTALAMIMATSKPPRTDEAKQLYQRARNAGAGPNPILDELLQEQ